MKCFDEILAENKNDSTALYHKARSIMMNSGEVNLELLEKACNLDPAKRQMLSIDSVFLKAQSDQRFRRLLI